MNTDKVKAKSSLLQMAADILNNVVPVPPVSPTIVTVLYGLIFILNIFSLQVEYLHSSVAQVETDYAVRETEIK